jgi:serine protease AprX
MVAARIALLVSVALAFAGGAPAHAADRLLRFDPQKTSRAALEQRLDALGLQSVVLKKLPFAIATGDSALFKRARAVRGVVSTHANRKLDYELSRSAPLVFGGAETRQRAYAVGYDGSGVNVAVVDTGTDGLHPDLRERVVRNVKVLGTDDLGGVDEALYVECPVACNTDTTGGHGTHVSGIAVGDGTASQGHHTGVAPGAGIVGLSVGEAVATIDVVAAYDYLLAHPELEVAAVNNSFGAGGGARFDARDPINVGTKALADAGMAVVFSAGNYGSGNAQPKGSSDCSPEGPSDGCKTNPYAVAPWAIAVGMTRDDHEGGPGDQPLNWSSSRGDDEPQRSLDGGYLVDYRPDLVAPGTNITAARDSTGTSHPVCAGGLEVTACIPERAQDDPFYSTLTGTSMAAPHVVGAIAVIQSAAVAKNGKRLPLRKLREVLLQATAPMTKLDALYDGPCPYLTPCGSQFGNTTGEPYQPWQVGAGALDLSRVLRKL